MRLTGVEIKDVYNIKNAKLDLSEGLALVVGPNGCGKTNIIKCISQVLEKASSTTLYNYTSEKGPVDSFINLHFNLNESERDVFLQNRIIFIAIKMLKLFELILGLNERRRRLDPKKNPVEALLSDSTRKFIDGIFPLLLEVSSSDNLNKWQNLKNSADVTISHQRFERPNDAELIAINIMNVKLTDNRNREAKIISDFLKVQFGEEVLQNRISLPTPDSRIADPKEESVEDIIGNILSHERFLRSENVSTSAPGSKFYDSVFDISHWLVRELTSRYYKQPSKRLYESIKEFMKQGTACILPQSRGFSSDEQGELYWSLEKAEKKIVEAYLWRPKSKENDQLNKVKEAMIFITGLELDVGRYRHDIMPNPPESDTEISVILRECNKPKAEWRQISQLSGGQRELLMVLSAIHLTGVDTVLLDEPGHSLHPPKQAQLRRWFEKMREPNQALLAITHSSDMIGPRWLGALYHMFADGHRYSSACFREIPENNEPDAGNEGSKQAENDPSLAIDCPSGSKALHFPDDNGVGEPPLGPRISPETTLKDASVEVSVGMIDFLMGIEMRRLFFSCGVVFVEGDTDRRIIQALRAVELEKVDCTLNDRSSNFMPGNDAHQEIDSWDIIPIYGSANWLKAYMAAEDLNIPFVVVLDADVLNKKRGSKVQPITYEHWKQSRLNRLISKSRYGENHLLKKLVKNVDQLLEKNRSSMDRAVREELQRGNLWVWNNGDIEDLFFTNKRVREEIFKNKQFLEIMEELQVSLPGQPSSDGNQMSATRAMKNFQDNCFSYFISEVVGGMDEQFGKIMEDLKEHPQNTEMVTNLSQYFKQLSGKFGQNLQNHVKFVQQGEKSVEAASEQFWNRVKKKLHDDGHWKRFSFKLLKEIVKISIEQQDHELHELWEHMKSRM